jgi:hypothetical protein
VAFIKKTLAEKGKMPVNFENYREHLNALSGQNAIF